jgi:hypothetical protein
MTLGVQMGSGLQYCDIGDSLIPWLGNHEWSIQEHWYHTLLRGNNGQTIFFDEKDHLRFTF